MGFYLLCCLPHLIPSVTFNTMIYKVVCIIGLHLLAKSFPRQALGHRLLFSTLNIHEMTVAPHRTICNLTGDSNYNGVLILEGTHCTCNHNHLPLEFAHLILSSSKC